MNAPRTWASDLERDIAAALDAAGIRWERHEQLDFYLPDGNIYVEVKAFHAPRIARQMASQRNVIAIQGTQAAGWFADRLSRPVPMILTCPAKGCGERHVDEGEFATKPHHTHACQHCGHVWRPALVDTVGVQFLPGFKDPA